MRSCVDVPGRFFTFFVLPQKKVTKKAGTFANRSARKSSYTASNCSLMILRLSPLSLRAHTIDLGLLRISQGWLSEVWSKGVIRRVAAYGAWPFCLFFLQTGRP